MSERTALFLASLSHQWLLAICSLLLVFGVATYYAGKRLARARASENVLTERLYQHVRLISCALFVAHILLLGVAITHLGCATLKAHSAECLSNMKQLGLAMMLYAQDYDERLPASIQWSEAIDSRVRETVKEERPADDDPFRCPAAESPASYGMNAAMSGLSLSDIDAPATLVLLFDADAPIRSLAGGARYLAKERHGNAPNVVFADGHTRHANVFVQKNLTWTPKLMTGTP